MRNCDKVNKTLEKCGIPRPQIDWGSQNLSNERKKFTEHQMFMFQGTLMEQREDAHVTMLLLKMGAKQCDIYRATNLIDKKTNKIFEKIQEHIAPKVNTVFSRYQFKNIIQGEKTIEQFITSLKSQADEWDFGDFKS